MSLEYRKLRGRIIEKYSSLTNFAEVLGVNKNTVSRKMTSVIGFSQEDIVTWSELLDIPKEEYGTYFFS